MSTDWGDLIVEAGPSHASLTDRFVVPPFSILNTTAGYWQQRKRWWLSLGLQSELGRGSLEIDDDGVARDRSAPGGSLMPSMKQRDGGGFARADGRGRAIEVAPRGPADVHAVATGQGGALADNIFQSGAGRSLQPGGNARSDYGAYIASPGSRREADQRANEAGNLTGSGQTPEWATGTGTENIAPGTSIFDPVLAELAYRWWCPPGGVVLDPFAGGSVRGIVAAYLGHPYVGVDLSGRQIAANRVQAEQLLDPEKHPVPRWHEGDSKDVLPRLDVEVDMVFSCPPYYDLEVYSDDPRDLSAIPSYPIFVEAYREIISQACMKLRPGRFACFVVSEIRDKQGNYRGFVPDTIAAFRLIGMRFYNEAILVNSPGSLPIRVTKQFEASRKLGRMHQNVLVFVKGDPERGWSYEREAPPDPQQGFGL